jgi:hypothetical protein
MQRDFSFEVSTDRGQVTALAGSQKREGQNGSVLNLNAGSSRSVLISDSELRAVHSLLLGFPNGIDFANAHLLNVKA